MSESAVFSPSEAYGIVNALHRAGASRESLCVLYNQRLGTHLALRCAAVVACEGPLALEWEAFWCVTAHILRQWPHAYIFVRLPGPSDGRSSDPPKYRLDLRLAPPYAVDRLLTEYETGVMISTTMKEEPTPACLLCAMMRFAKLTVEIERENEEFIPPDLRGHAVLYRVSR